MALPTVAVTAGSGTTINTLQNAGQTTMANSHPVVIASDQAAVPVSGTVSVSSLPAIPTGANAIGSITNTSFASTQSGTWTVQPGNTANTTPWLAKVGDGTNSAAIKAASTAPVAADPAMVVAISPNSVNANGQNTMANSAPVVLASNHTAIPTNPTAIATGGSTTFHLVSAATTNATNIKASQGKLTGYYIYNSNAAARKVAFHNSATAPTAGASVAFSLVIPPTSGANLSGAEIDFSAGIGISTVTGLADTDATAVALNDLIINIWYK